MLVPRVLLSVMREQRLVTRGQRLVMGQRAVTRCQRPVTKGQRPVTKGQKPTPAPHFPPQGAARAPRSPLFPRPDSPTASAPPRRMRPRTSVVALLWTLSHPFCIVEARAGGNIQFTLNIQEGESPLLTARGVLHPSTAFVPLGARAPRSPLEPHRSSPTCLTAGPCVQKDAVPKTSLKSPNPAPLHPPPALHPPRG